MKEILKESNYDSRSFNQLAYILARDILNIQQWSKNLDNSANFSIPYSLYILYHVAFKSISVSIVDAGLTTTISAYYWPSRSFPRSNHSY